MQTRGLTPTVLALFLGIKAAAENYRGQKSEHVGLRRTLTRVRRGWFAWLATWQGGRVKAHSPGQDFGVWFRL